MERISQRTTIAVLAFALIMQGHMAWTSFNAAPPAKNYKKVRASFLVHNAKSAGNVETVILGDSIAESIWLDGVCGPTFNASIAGARTQQISAVGEDIFAHFTPEKILIAIGTNDVLQGKGPDKGLQKFKKDYDAMLAKLPVKPFALVGIGNSETANDYVREKAGTLGVTFIPPIATEYTRDGIHPDIKGRKMWRERAEQACSQS